jgi:hypothetical protein
MAASRRFHRPRSHLTRLAGPRNAAQNGDSAMPADRAASTRPEQAGSTLPDSSLNPADWRMFEHG